MFSAVEIADAPTHHWEELARRLDDQDPEPGYDGMLWEGATDPDGHFLGWTSGKAPFLEPPALAAAPPSQPTGDPVADSTFCATTPGAAGPMPPPVGR